MMRSPLRVCFATHYKLDPDDDPAQAWRNPRLVSRFIAQALEAQGVELEFHSAEIPRRYRCYFGRKYRLIERFTGKQSLLDREPAVLRCFGRQLSRHLNHSDTQVVFSPSTIPIARVRCRQPVVYWTDATFAGVLGFYPQFSRLTHGTIRHGHACEQAAMDRASIAIYASRWAAQTARDHYRIDPDKLKILPRGANITTDPTAEQAHAWIDARPRDCCRLLWIGGQWRRKGGPTAVAVAEALNRAGQPTELVVVGIPPEQAPPDLPPCVKVQGFVSKATARGRQTMDGLLSRAHFVLIPSRAECLSITALEAAAFGVPSVGYRVGGTPDAIRDGVSGRLLDPDQPPNAFCSFIRQHMRDPDAYRRLARGAHQAYREHYNWRVVGRRLQQWLEAAARPTRPDGRGTGGTAPATAGPLI